MLAFHVIIIWSFRCLSYLSNHCSYGENMRYKLFFVFTSTIILFFQFNSCTFASSLLGKTLQCTNSRLSNRATMRFNGLFTSETHIEGTLNLSFPSRSICDLGRVSISADRNRSGSWVGDQVSFDVSADGYVNNFKFSQSTGSFGTCRIEMTNLEISGSVLPFIHLLMN